LLSGSGCRRSEAKLEPIEVFALPPTAASAIQRSGPPVRLVASKYLSKIRRAPHKDAPRIGYLRSGSTLLTKSAEPLGFADCRKGWFELETGGYVCATTDFAVVEGSRLPQRPPTAPDPLARLPYPYGYSQRKDTPVYRRIPTEEEVARYELRTHAPPSTHLEGTNAGAGAPPTLESLRGEEGGVLLRRMERGFYVSLDREVDKNGRSYWQTQSAGYIPKQRLVPVEGSDFHGIDLALTGGTLPVGFAGPSARARAYVADARGRLHVTEPPAFRRAFSIVGTSMHRSEPLYVAADAVQHRARGVTRVDRRDKPPEVADSEKWIDVDLASQSLVAYVGARPVYVTLISSGRSSPDPLDPTRDFKTPNGTFRITSKHLSATMDGDHAVDGPYSIEDVPYVMYFQLAYALHAAFWHNAFGRPRSHGCINLAPDDARWLFSWVDPPLPHAWHGVFPGEHAAGTRVYVRGETPPG
jgi:hypothetical protein